MSNQPFTENGAIIWFQAWHWVTDVDAIPTLLHEMQSFY